MNDIDSVLIAGKSEATRINSIRVARTDEVWHQPFLPARDNKDADSVRIVYGQEYRAPKGRKWGLSQDDVETHCRHNKIKVDENGNIKYSPLWRNIKNDWTDIPGYSRRWDFETENAEQLLARAIQSMTNENDRCLDFFAGSGTTQAVAQKLGRKWLGVEMGAHFDSVILPRLKKTLAGERSGVSGETGYKGGGAFKYYALEQYEESLRNARYGNADLTLFDANKPPFAQYVFLNDDKCAHAVKVGASGRKIKLGLSSLYKDIDIAETLANAIGLQLRGKTKDTATFADGRTMKINPDNMREEEKMELLSYLKPYLWWGE